MSRDEKLPSAENPAGYPATAPSALPKQRKATRAKFSKVRTGCVTCKRRHVKCDETKPCCRNCMKWAGYCSGYESPDGQQNAPSAQASISVRTTNESAQTKRPGRPHAGGEAASGQGRASRERPCPCAAERASAAPQAADRCLLDETFWRETMPRLVRDSEAVQYAHLAVQKLIRAKGAAGSGHGADEYGRALACHGHALRAARQASASQADLREAILCSLFFVVFETINGDQSAAAAHLQSGQRVLDALGPPPTPNLRLHLRHVAQLVAAQTRPDASVLQGGW